MKTLFILNSASGKLRKDKGCGFVQKIHSIAPEFRLSPEIVITQAPRHAVELARQAVNEGVEQIVAVGGDGTMNEVAQGVVGTDAILGLIPMGSGNGLGRHLGICGSLNSMMEILSEGGVKTIDTGTVNGIPFFNVMGIGFDAEMSQGFNSLPKRGLSGYLRVGLKLFMRYQPQTYILECEERTKHEIEAWLIAVANSAQFGNQAYIAPKAEVDDGLLDLTALRLSHRLGAIPLALRLFAKNIDKSKAAHTKRGCSFKIYRQQPGIIHTDGEVHKTTAELSIHVRPGSLKIKVPSRL